MGDFHPTPAQPAKGWRDDMPKAEDFDTVEDLWDAFENEITECDSQTAGTFEHYRELLQQAAKDELEHTMAMYVAASRDAAVAEFNRVHGGGDGAKAG